MTKRFLVVFAVCFMLLPMLDAQANVIEPPRNRFLSQHRNELVILDRFFFANGESGSVSVKDAPNSNTEVAVIENNEAYFISYTSNYQGEIWGALIHTNDRTHTPTNDRRRRLNPQVIGWVPMNQLLLRYDRISFVEEHEDEFYPFTGSYEALKTAEEIVLWTWPGSGVIRHIGIFDVEKIVSVSSFARFFLMRRAFMDEQGREWVFFDRFRFPGRSYFHSDVWINLSDPSNTDIPAFNPPRPVAWQPAGTDISTVANISINTDNLTSEPPISELIIILVAGLSVSTATLIRVFWKPNKRA